LGCRAATCRRSGAPGIARGTTPGAVTTCAILGVGLRRVAGPLPVARRTRQSLGLVVANGLMGGLVFGGWWAWQEWVPLALQHGTFAQLGMVATLVGVGFSSYVACLRAFGYPGADLLASLPGKIFKKLRGR